MPEPSSDNSSSENPLCVEHLSLGYGERAILKDVNFCIEHGQIVTVLGGSGSGKSTLLKGIAGLLTPMQGNVHLFGREMNASSLEWARKKIGVLFQSGALISSLTLAENIALPIHEFSGAPKEIIDDIVRLKLEMVRLGPYESYYPAELSGGMRKRAGLARAMALDPQILLCDEPTTGLDPVIASEMDKLLIELKESLGITMLVITHDLSTIASISDWSIMLDASAAGVIAGGPPEELRNSEDPRVYRFFRRDPPSTLGYAA